MKCIHCGKVLPDNAIKCYSCGQSTGRNSKTQQQTPPSNSRQSNTQYGQVIKCPACGGMINPFQTQCVCGYVVRGVKNVTSVADLAQEIQEIERQRSSHAYQYTSNTYDEDIIEQQKIELIKYFPIPNTKEDIVEFMLLSQSCIENKDFRAFRMWGTLSYDTVSSTWLAKREQVYKKAEMLFLNTPEWTAIEQVYDKFGEHSGIKSSNKRKHTSTARNNCYSKYNTTVKNDKAGCGKVLSVTLWVILNIYTFGIPALIMWFIKKKY